MVEASDTNGVWSQRLATAEFTILPAWYQKGWFLPLLIMATLGVFYLLYVLRLKQVTQQVRGRMQERLEERENRP